MHELLAMVLEHGFSTFSLTSEDPQTIQRFGEEVAPALREAVTRERQLAGTTTDVVLRGPNALALRRGTSTTSDFPGHCRPRRSSRATSATGGSAPPTPVPGHRDR